MSKTTRLRLPGGAWTEFEGDPRDLSVWRPVSQQDGEWESHVRRTLESIIRPDWVCLDIGANIGAHTLSMARLAHVGQVFAFEPGTQNFAYLERNIACLPEPKAAVEAVRCALWDESGTLSLAAFTELAGCSFLSQGDADGSRTLIRQVVTAESVARSPIHVEMDSVPSMRLDDWVRARGLQRLDLVKLDVEGAETRVLEGAQETLRWFRPVLLTEYNPACAQTYFGRSQREYWERLSQLYPVIRVIRPEGGYQFINRWEELRESLKAGRGWEDLICQSG